MLGPVTKELFDTIASEFKKEETQEKIKTAFLDPVLGYLQAKVFTYLQFLGLLMAIMIILLIVILVMIWKKK